MVNVLSLLLALAPPAWTHVRPGVDYRAVTLAVEGPAKAHLVRVDLTKTQLRALRAATKRTPKHLSEAARKAGVTVVAAVNGDFFDFKGNQAMPWGLCVSRGEIVREPTDKSVLFVDAAGPRIDRLRLEATVRTGGAAYELARINTPCTGDELTLYNGAMGPSVPGATREGALVLTGLDRPLRLNATSHGTVAALDRPVVSAGGAVLVGCGRAAAFLAGRQVGAQVEVSLTVPGTRGAILEAVGGGPRILRDGKVSIELEQEDLPKLLRFYLRSRHPRSAVCLGPGMAVLAHVEGRRKDSVGLRPEPLAELLRTAGCRDAMMFDGGGSATMVLDGRTLGPFGKRGVANALAAVIAP